MKLCTFNDIQQFIALNSEQGQFELATLNSYCRQA